MVLNTQINKPDFLGVSIVKVNRLTSGLSLFAPLTGFALQRLTPQPCRYVTKRLHMKYILILGIFFFNTTAVYAECELSPIPNNKVPSLYGKGCWCAFFEKESSNKVLFVYDAESGIGNINSKVITFKHKLRNNVNGTYTNKYKNKQYEITSIQKEISLNKECASYPEELYHISCYSTELKLSCNGNKTQQLKGTAACGC